MVRSSTIWIQSFEKKKNYDYTSWLLRKAKFVVFHATFNYSVALGVLVPAKYRAKVLAWMHEKALHAWL